MDIKNIIIQKVDLPEFIRERTGVELHRSGNGWRCKCPIHDGSENPSAMFIDDHGGYYCYACNSGGNVINFLADYEHITYSAATEQLASMLNINLQTDAEYQSQKEIERKYEQEKEQGIRGLENVYQYLTEKRGFTDSTIQAFALGSHNGCLTIPLIDVNGRAVGMARRQFDKQPKYINSKNNALLDKSEYFFGFDKARRLVREKMYVVEGYMDAMSGYQMGLPTVACCSNGLSKDQVRVLSQSLRRETAIILCPDNDEAGHKRIPRIREYFNSIDPGRQIRIVVVPDEFKDMNDMLLAGVNPADLPTEHMDKYVMDLLLNGCSTPEEEYACAEGYLPTVRSEMIRLDIIKMLAERWEKDVDDLKRYFNTVGEDSNDLIQEASDVNGCLADLRKIYSVGGYKTHFQQIDNCIRKVEKKQVVIIGAFAGVGKTDFSIEYVLRQICQEKMRVIFFSLEMPKGKLIERVIAKLVGCSISEVEGYIASDDTTVQQAISKIQDHLLVYDGNNYTIQDIEKRIQAVNSKNVLGAPVDMVVVDYFGYMKGTSDFEGASSSATKMKAIAKENNIIFVMLSQLNRGGNPYGEPNMQQLKLTGDLEASADVIMLLWRPEKDPNLSIAEKQELENVTRLKIDKARDGMFGSNLAEFAYNRETSRLEEHYM